MSSDYIPRLRQELLRAGATQPARWRPARVVRPLGSLAAAAAVVLIVVGLVIALPGGGVEDDATPASEPVRLEYRVVPASAAEETAEVMRTRLAAVGLEDARVSVTASAGLTIDAPAEARDDVVALTQRGVFAIYDWERSVLGPRRTARAGRRERHGRRRRRAVGGDHPGRGRGTGRSGVRTSRPRAGRRLVRARRRPRADQRRGRERRGGDRPDDEGAGRRHRVHGRRTHGVHHAHARRHPPRHRQGGRRRRRGAGAPAPRDGDRRPDRLRALHRPPARTRTASTAPPAARSRVASPRTPRARSPRS